MAIIVSSGSFCPRHPRQGAKPPLLRSLAWTLGIQAAVGGTLIMIHDQVISEGGASGVVCISCVDVERSTEASLLSRETINISPPEPASYRQASNKVKEVKLSSLVMSDLLVTHDIPRVEEKAGLFLSTEELGLMIRSKEKAIDRPKNQPEKIFSKGGGQMSSSPLAGASSEKGTSGSSSARYKSAPSPPYPHSARAEGREGVVMLKVLIDETGTPSEVDIAKSSGCLTLDDTALNWVRKNWLFYPAMNETGPVASTMIAPLRFKLSK